MKKCAPDHLILAKCRSVVGQAAAPVPFAKTLVYARLKRFSCDSVQQKRRSETGETAPDRRNNVMCRFTAGGALKYSMRVSLVTSQRPLEHGDYAR